MNNCETCKHWKAFGMSRMGYKHCIRMDSEDNKIRISANNRDGEWVGVEVETKSDFGCVLHVPKA